jgi:hypothetical protein
MLVELGGAESPGVYYHRLVDGAYQLASRAHAGEILRIDDPVVIEFDPAELVDL